MPTGESAAQEWRREMSAPQPTWAQRQRQRGSIRQQRESLPIFALRQSFLEAIAKYQILVVIGETGSGKSTQMPQVI
jgi:ATP-dependent RNA helicase DHX8/PRP22